MKNLLKYLAFICFLFCLSTVNGQKGWKKFNSKKDGYELLLPSSFELGPRLSSGIIQWFSDSTHSDIQMWIEVDSNSKKSAVLFVEHQEGFSNIDFKKLDTNSFVISGSQSIGLSENSFCFEKCLIKDDFVCILRILYTGASKAYLEKNVNKISDSFNSIAKK
jgi:hypothetical protein